MEKLLLQYYFLPHCADNCTQIKLASVKLAVKYMKRVSGELEMVGGSPEEEELIVQGVKFAFRVHQVSDSASFEHRHVLQRGQF